MADEQVIAKLNEVVDVLSGLTTGRLRDLIGPGRGVLAAGCTGNCDCRGGYCGCNASVTAREKYTMLSFPEFIEMRQERVRELQSELARLELPKDIKER